MSPLRNPIALRLRELVPPPGLFVHASTIHGQDHVARVMVYALLLLEETGMSEEAVRLWAAVYLHDLARTHDGVCHEHGRNAVLRLDQLPEVRGLFARAGVQETDYPAIHTAVTQHSIPSELEATHRHYPLTALLKDADGLDRVRLGDLDPAYLRFPETHTLVPFAEELYAQTQGKWPVGEDYFEQLWPEVQRMAGLLRQRIHLTTGTPCDAL